MKGCNMDSSVFHLTIAVGLLWLAVGWQLWLMWALDRRMRKLNLEYDKVVVSDLMSLTPIACPDGTTSHKYTWNDITNPPWDVIHRLRGRINSTEWDGMAARTALFLGASAELTHDESGNERWNITYSFIERQWNHCFPYACLPRGWPYELSADFSSLFVQDGGTPETDEKDKVMSKPEVKTRDEILKQACKTCSHRVSVRDNDCYWFYVEKCPQQAACWQCRDKWVHPQECPGCHEVTECELFVAIGEHCKTCTHGRDSEPVGLYCAYPKPPCDRYEQKDTDDNEQSES